MYKTLVVALDLDGDGDRALPVVEALARSGPVAVDLVTVCEPGLDTTVDAFELERRAARHGWGRDAWTIVRDVDTAGGLVQHAARRADALVVMATSARRPWMSSLSGGVTRDVLQQIDRPVLLVGPGVVHRGATSCTTLVGCVGPDEPMDRAIPAIVDWQETFTTTPPQFAEVLPIGTVDDTAAQGRLADLAARLARHNVHGGRTVVYDDDVLGGLEALAASLPGPVYVATSARYTDGRLHWHSTTQQLVQHATNPVLVVSARPTSRPHGRPIGVDEHVAFHDLTTPARGSAR